MKNCTTFTDTFVKSLMTEGALLDVGLTYKNDNGQIVRLFTMLYTNGVKFMVCTVDNEIRVITDCAV